FEVAQIIQDPCRRAKCQSPFIRASRIVRLSEGGKNGPQRVVRARRSRRIHRCAIGRTKTSPGESPVSPDLRQAFVCGGKTRGQLERFIEMPSARVENTEPSIFFRDTEMTLRARPHGCKQQRRRQSLVG